jgi:multiple sugar transport system permease protein
VSVAVEHRRRARKQAQRRRRLTVLAFMSPWLVGFSVFFAYPLVATVYFSFTHYDLLEPARWIGLANYEFMFTEDSQIWTAVRNTLWLVVIMVPLKVMFAFGVALMLTRARRGIGVFRAIFYLPALVSGIAIAILWTNILHPDYGLINATLAQVGITGPGWLKSQDWAMPGLILMSLWGIGGTIIIYLAGLQGVPQQLYEAASIDGAGRWGKLRHVTLPMMTPTIFFTMVIGLIASFQVFTPALVITDGGPGTSTLFYLLHLYRNGFRWFNMGYASAMAWLLFVIILVFTLLQLRLSRRWVYYEGESRKR